MENKKRYLEDVETILEHAKLDRQAELLPTAQCLYFSAHLDNDSMKLMEINDEILQHLTTGERVTIRGVKKDHAVLCTKRKTYKILQAELSNNLLLVPDCKLPSKLPEEDELKHIKVCAMKQAYYELREVLPRLGRLRELLSENVYSGRELEKDDDHQGQKYTWSELLEHVQASEDQLKKGLNDLHACQIDGYWRILDFDYVGTILTSILQLRDEEDWPMDAVPCKATADVLQDLYPRTAIAQTLLYFSLDTPHMQEVDTADVNLSFSISEDKVCRYSAELLLKLSEQYHLGEFEKSWQLAVPEGMQTGLHQLEGLALIDQDSKPPYIEYFPVANLPEDVEERFTQLFKKKAKWTLAEITPYLKDVATAKTGVGALLLKFARASTQNGIKVYNSKKPIA